MELERLDKRMLELSWAREADRPEMLRLRDQRTEMVDALRDRIMAMAIEPGTSDIRD
jgi:hypothetical protein